MTEVIFEFLYGTLEADWALGKNLEFNQDIMTWLEENNHMLYRFGSIVSIPEDKEHYKTHKFDDDGMFLAFANMEDALLFKLTCR